ncbi:MAG: AMP-binding protein [Betaproteobacteria bacterium]
MNRLSPNLIPLHSLFEGGRSDDQVVCHNDQGSMVWREFSAQVLSLAGQLKGRSEQRWLLAVDDPQVFAIRLLALLFAGKQVVIPHNAQPGTLGVLADVFDARMEDGVIDVPEVSGYLAALDPQQAIIDLYTSGSTGQPKRVRKTLAQFEAEIEVLESLWGPAVGNASIVATVPHQHIYGLLFRLLWPLSAGRPFDAVTCAHPDTLEERLLVLGDAVLISSPAQLGRMPELLSLASLKPALKAVFSSGGSLPAVAADAFFRQLGQAPVEVFGSTETGGIAWRCQEGGGEADLWTPFPGIDVACSNNGALSLLSPFLDSAAHREMDDAIELKPDGRFRLLGRLDRIVKIEEKRLSLPDMEQQLNAHSWVENSAVLPLPGRRQSLGALLVLHAEGRQFLESQGRRALSQILRTHLKQHFETVLLPRHWRFVDQLPIDERGKTSLAKLQSLFASEDPLYPEILRVHHSPDGAAHVVLDLCVPASIGHFSGHFPGLPILPGVVQIDWAVRYAREHLALSGHFSSLENIKFLALIMPDTKLSLSLKWNAATRRLEFSYSTSQRSFSTGRILFSGPG